MPIHKVKWKDTGRSPGVELDRQPSGAGSAEAKIVRACIEYLSPKFIGEPMNLIGEPMKAIFSKQVCMVIDIYRYCLNAKLIG